MTRLPERFAAAMAVLPNAPATGATLVVAVSGGADSMALWDLLVRAASWRLVVWHLNHELRAEAPQDAELIRSQAERYQSQSFTPGEVIIDHAPVADLARQWHLSLEAAGRRYRYERLATVAREQGAVAVLTAHHRDDQSETVLANLLRGAGPIGAAGIAPRRVLSGGVVLLRPLLAVARAELREYCATNEVRWLEDVSNADQRHRRNHLRHVVLPALEGERPGIGVALAELGERSREVAVGLEQVVDQVWPRALSSDALALIEIMALAEQPRWHVWRRLARHLGIAHERAHLERIDQLATGAPGRRLHLGRWLLLRRAQVLTWELARPLRHEHPVEIQGPGDYSSASERITCRVLPRPQTIAFTPEDAWIDAACCTLPLVWRAAEPEERFTPLGAPGRQTVVKYLASRGVASRLRAEAAVVADGDGIVWIPGFAIAERVKISETTRDVVHLRLHLHRSVTCGTAAAPTVPTLQETPDVRSD